jgi:hypothetical protein
MAVTVPEANQTRGLMFSAKDHDAVKEFFPDSEEIIEDVEFLMDRGNDFITAIQETAIRFRVDVEQVIPMLKRSKLFVRLQSEALSLRLIKPPKKRGRGRGGKASN